MDFNRFSKSLQCSVESEATEWEGKEKNKRAQTDDKEGGESLDMEEKECKLCPRADDSEVDRFFALLERIQAMRKLFKRKQTNWSSAEKRPKAQNMGGKDIKQISSWKPTFMWEDFSISSGEASPSAQMDLSSCTENNTGRSGRSLKPDSESDNYKQVKSFDLNLEARFEN
ncbi:hypothetical protein SUGI_0465480 [Cryptomeria japonica]|nr:hypothetical protein SUGI_0465480 [Cryptomeria japonica]